MTGKFALTAAIALALCGTASAQGIDPIQTRQTAYDLLAGDFAGINAAIAGGGDIKKLENPAKAIVRFGKLIPSLYPAGSDKGGDTKALPEIWTDNAGFQKAALALSTAAEALAAAAKAGDADAVKASIKPIGDACGACHKAYRAK